MQPPVLDVSAPGQMIIGIARNLGQADGYADSIIPGYAYGHVAAIEVDLWSGRTQGFVETPLYYVRFT